MNTNALIDGLIGYLCLLILLTFHEFAHAWTSWKCGDDTAYREGRVSLNPIVHMDVLGTLVLPLAVVFLGAMNSGLAKFIIGWGKPVPVDPYNLRRPRLHDTLIALAGPAMNLVLAFLLIASLHLFIHVSQPGILEVRLPGIFGVIVRTAQISLMLCFFNLLPVPPLDGSHFLKNLIGMSDETYIKFAQYGFLIVILLLQVPMVRNLLGFVTQYTFYLLLRLAHLPVGV